MTPPSLFDPPAPSKRGALPTSAAQGRVVETARRRYEVMRLLYDLRTKSNRGRLYADHLTADAIGERLKLAPLAIRPRVSQCYTEGWLEDSGERAESAGGGMAARLRISVKGIVALQRAEEEKDPVAALERMFREGKR